MGKTECILFGTSRRLKGKDFMIWCGDAIVKKVTSVRYLGVLLDQHLRFDEYVRSILKKASGRLSFLYRSAPCLDVRSHVLLSSSLVSSGLEYCLPGIQDCHVGGPKGSTGGHAEEAGQVCFKVGPEGTRGK
jgi:hypothetical protein